MVHVKVDKFEADVPDLLVPLITEVWKAGIATAAAELGLCGDRVTIEFASPWTLKCFLDIVSDDPKLCRRFHEQSSLDVVAYLEGGCPCGDPDCDTNRPGYVLLNELTFDPGLLKPLVDRLRAHNKAKSA